MKKYAVFLLLFLFLTQAGQSYAAPPNWSATPANYELSATMTATLYLDFVAVEGEGNLVGAFVGDECRGVASPIRVLDSWAYFLTIFSNTNGEIIRLKAYVAAQDRILDAEETIAFSANGAYGDPANPLALHTILNYDFPPSVSGIPDQKVELGNPFASIDLKSYLVEKDGDSIVWSYSSDNFFLTVAIDAAGVATITPTRTDWTGTGNITFTANDQTDKKLTGSDSAVFTALPPDHPPEVKPIPNQTIGIAGTFASIPFAEHLTENDGDQVAWSYRFRTSDKEGARPTWAVQPADYELSMTVTATVRSRGEPTAGGDFLLGAFAGEGALETCRGVATPVEVLGSWVYFMTVYSNSFGEEIRFRFFDPRTREALPVREKISFAPNSAHGSPTSPTQLGAGYLYVEIGGSEAQIGLVDESWNGAETIEFIVADLGTLNGYTDTAAVTFNVLANHQPLVTGIADQIVEVGNGFAAFDLDDHLTELDGDQIVWSAAGNSALRVDIDAGNEVTVTPFNAAWTGRDTVVFTAMDLFSLLIYAIGEKNAFTNSDTVVFGIVPKDHPPVLTDIPDQTIGLLGSFAPIPLSDYLTEVDGDQIDWSYEFPPPAQPAASPSWSVQPAAYELAMSIAAVVTSRGQKKGAGGHLLGAFVGEECRGIASPVAALDSWVYFLVVYANQNGETMRFQFFDADAGEILPVAQTKSFQANATHGDPQHPDGFDAGLLLVNIGDGGRAAISIVDPLWSGSEELSFSARDVGTIHDYAVSDRVTFTVLPDHQPQVRAISGQTVEQGTSFQSFDLDAYLVEEDGDPVRWSAGSATNLQVSIDAANRVSVTPIIPTWSGGETVTFTATDQTPNQFAGSGSVRFTVLPPDHAPVVGDIPDRSIRKNRSFAPFDLDSFLSESDGDPIAWSFSFPTANPSVGVPAWSVAAADYELSMSATVAVDARGQPIAGEGHRLAVFAGDECRGVASPVFTLDRWLFFLNIYANGGGRRSVFNFTTPCTGRSFRGGRS